MAIRLTICFSPTRRADPNSFDLINQNRQQTVHVRVDLSESFNSPNCVAHGCVVPPVVELADLRKAPTAYPLGQVHGDLPIECRRLRISRYTRTPQSFRNDSVNFGQGRLPHRYPVVDLRHKHGCSPQAEWHTRA
jgi:hypothetical protein